MSVLVSGWQWRQRKWWICWNRSTRIRILSRAVILAAESTFHLVCLSISNRLELSAFDLSWSILSTKVHDCNNQRSRSLLHTVLFNKYIPLVKPSDEIYSEYSTNTISFITAFLATATYLYTPPTDYSFVITFVVRWSLYLHSTAYFALVTSPSLNIRDSTLMWV